MSTIATIEADFKTWPYLHQLKEFELSCEMKARALLWQMRSGKTKVIIDTACHLYQATKIDAVLVIAPNGVHENWIRRELPTHHWDNVSHSTLIWRTEFASKKYNKKFRIKHIAFWQKFSQKILNNTTQLVWLAIASDTMIREDVRKMVAKFIKKHKVLVIFDESHDFRTPSSKRTHMARALAKRCLYRRILTGTVVTNSPLHAWSQFELLEPSALGFSKYGAFKDNYSVYEEAQNRKGHRYKVLIEYKNLDNLQDRMLPWSSVILREDCADLPDVIYRYRAIEMTDEQKKIYREIHNTYLLEIDNTEVSIGENAPKFMKLQQVGGGFVKDEFGDIQDIPGPNPKLEALSEEVYLASGKVIVWCQFQEDIDRVVNRLISDGHTVVQYHGRINNTVKQEAIDSFQNDDTVKVIVGQPKSGGQGLDLSAAGLIIGYSHTFDAIIRSQANERATEIGGENVQMVLLVANKTDEYILENILDKVSLADSLAGKGMRMALEKVAL